MESYEWSVSRLGDFINREQRENVLPLPLGSLLAYRRKGWEALIKTLRAARVVTIQPSATQQDRSSSTQSNR